MEILPTYCLCGQPYEPGKFMVQCDCCKDWFHSSCVSLKEYNVSDIEKYHCPRCYDQHGPSIYKQRTNWHRNNMYEKEPKKNVQSGTVSFVKELQLRHFAKDVDVVVHMRGQQLTDHYFKTLGFDKPIVIDGKDGLDMTIPANNFSLYDVESYVGGEMSMDVIDVQAQKNFKMILRDFVEYYNAPDRTKVFNVISLEFSQTGLSSLVEAPLVARKLDWVNTVWPRENLGQAQRPEVQKYCLMSVRDSYTDFHIDFGGTSVWYHVLRGEKVFYLIEPTEANLTLYRQWMNSRNHSETFFGDQVDVCYKVVLKQGQTMFIPTGWVHAVLTTADSLVFGGNFLHSLNIPMQLEVYEIEKKTKVPDKFRFPLFECINWFAARRIITQLKELNEQESKCPERLLEGSKALLGALKQWNVDKDYGKNLREYVNDINTARILKDLSKEIRHAERYLLSLNPPKPERESKRKKRKPMHKDFDYSQPFHSEENIRYSGSNRIQNTLKSPKSNTNLISRPPLKLTLPKTSLIPYVATPLYDPSIDPHSQSGTDSDASVRSEHTGGKIRPSWMESGNTEPELLPVIDNTNSYATPPSIKRNNRKNTRVKSGHREQINTSDVNGSLLFPTTQQTSPAHQINLALFTSPITAISPNTSPIHHNMSSELNNSPAKIKNILQAGAESYNNRKSYQKSTNSIENIDNSHNTIPNDLIHQTVTGNSSFGSPTSKFNSIYQSSVSEISNILQMESRNFEQQRLARRNELIEPINDNLVNFKQSVPDISKLSGMNNMSVITNLPPSFDHLIGTSISNFSSSSPFKSKNISPSVNVDISNSKNESVYDFHDGSNDEAPLTSKTLTRSPLRRKKFKEEVMTTGRLKMRIPVSEFPASVYMNAQSSTSPAVTGTNESEIGVAENPKNGIESLLKASAYTNRFVDSGRASPSTREAIAGMLSIGQSTPSRSSSHGSRRRRKSSHLLDDPDDISNNVHQDEDYVYPSLDNTDDEEFVFKPRGKVKLDEPWNPKARLGPLLPKMNRPAREGTKKQPVAKVLEAAAAKRASESANLSPVKRSYIRKKPKSLPREPAGIVSPVASTSGAGTSGVTPNASQTTSSPQKTPTTVKPKNRKGMKTAKQRLGRILKLHKMMK